MEPVHTDLGPLGWWKVAVPLALVTMVNSCAKMAGLGVVFMSLEGCNTTGWEPGPSGRDQSTVPTPFGTFNFEGERDTVFTADLEGNDGTRIPNGSFSLSRSASGPLGTRGAQQLLIEDQRDRHFDRMLDRLDRRIDQIEDKFLSPMFTQRMAQNQIQFEQQPTSTSIDPTFKQQLQALIEQALRDRLGVPATSNPSVP